MYNVKIKYDAVNESFVLTEGDNCIELYQETVKGLYYMVTVLEKIDEFLNNQKEYTDKDLRKEVLCRCHYDFEEIKEKMLNDIISSKYNNDEEAMKEIWNKLVLIPFYQNEQKGE